MEYIKYLHTIFTSERLTEVNKYLLTVRGPRIDSKSGDPWYIEPTGKIKKSQIKHDRIQISNPISGYGYVRQ